MVGEGTLHQLLQDLLPAKEPWVNHCQRTCFQYRDLKFITAAGPASKYTLTNCMNKTPWDADSHSSNQKIPCLLCTPKIHYCVDNSSPLHSTQSIINEVHTLTLFYKIHVNTDLPSTVKFWKCLLPSDFFTIAYQFLMSSHVHYKSHPSHCLSSEYLIISGKITRYEAPLYWFPSF